MTLQSDNASATLPNYQFRLESSLKDVDLTTFPLEWEEGTLEINRRLDAGGVFSMFNIESLTFIKEGAALLKKLWDQKQMLAKCTLKIKYLKKSTLDYVEFPTSYSLKFISYKIVKVGNVAIGVNINAEQSGELDKFDNRRATVVDLTKTTSIGGYNIVDYDDLLKRLRIIQIDAEDKAYWNQSTIQTYDQSTNNTYYVYYPMTLINGVFSETQTIELTEHGSRDKTYAMFKESVEARTVDIDGTIELSIDTIVGDSQFRVRLEVLDAASGSVSSVNISPLYTSADSGNKTITVNETVTLATGESVVIYAFTFLQFPEQVKYNILSTEITFNETILTAPTTTIDSMPVYETGERGSQHIMDTQFPFYSEFLGREDVVYNLDGDFYPSENQLRFLSFASGLHIRGELLSSDNAPLSMSWDQWFQTVNSFWNLGYTFEIIDDFLRIRVEEYAFFYDDTEMLDLSSRISVFDILTEAMPELAHLNIKSGYKKFDASESVNGRGEANTLSTRTTIADSDAEFNNVSEIRGDTQGIANLLNAPVSNSGSTDEKGDEDVFAIKTQRDGGGADWDAETNENIAVDNDTYLFGDTGLNLYNTPARMLRRQGSRLKIALTKELSSYLRFQTMEKSQTLETTGETYTIIENEDILVNDLDDPLVRPIKHRVEVMLTWADIETILANPLQRITFSSSITGWILNIKKKNNEDKAVIEIIEKYVN